MMEPMHFSGSEEVVSFSEEKGPLKEQASAGRWKIIIADDEKEVHNITRMVLRDFTFDGLGVDFLSSYTGEDTRALIRDNPDTAVILLDVVMEHDDAGLDVVRYIRNDLKNNIVQIILRTGQAGQAPEQDVVERYEINDYKTKYEFTAQKLYTTITSSLRAFRMNNSINRLNAQLNEELRERKLAEEKILRLSRFQESVIDNAEIWMSVSDINEDVIVWNRAAERISGYTRDKVLGNSNVWQLLYPDRSQRNCIKEAGSLIFNNGSNRNSFETAITREDGSTRVILLEMNGLKDENGKPSAIIALAQDITEKKQLENKLLHAQKMEAVGRLAGGVAHDFNNILTVISGYSELSLLRVTKGEPLYENLSQIRLAAKRAESLTRQLLTFSRQQITNPVPIDLKVLLLEMDKMLIRVIGEDVCLETVFDPDLYKIKADPGSIEQVIMNMAVNARDAMPGGGKITISMTNGRDNALQTKQDQPHVVIRISDNGTGMDDMVKERIFEPFFTTKEVGKGTGLGLSTVYGIITQIGGTIDVWSEVGKGTVFTIYLPGLKPEMEVEIQDHHRSAVVRGTETVLIIEDQPDVLKLTAEMLRINGYTVYEAANNEEAQDVARAHGNEIRLIVADVIMPQKSGKEIVDGLKPVLPSARILFMSGYSDNIIEQKGISNREFHMIRKPFTIEELNRKVRGILFDS